MHELHILTPFERPDVDLVLASIKANAFPILHLGRDSKKAEEALKTLSQKTDKPFGVCLVSKLSSNIKLPANVTKILIPHGTEIPVGKNLEILTQIHSIKEAEDAIASGSKNLVIKGNEGAGKVANKSSFILFQAVMGICSGRKDIGIYVQGGLGIHNSSAVLALGAKGVIMDSQIVQFPECSSVPKDLKNICDKLSGSETSVIDNYRVLLRKNSPTLPTQAKYKDIEPFLGEVDLSENIIPMGQDISISTDLVEKYKKLEIFVTAFHEAAHGHIQQAKALQTMSPNSSMAKELGTTYPIAQGPMARVSDVPAFAEKVAEAGALPFVAMSMSQGKAAEKLVSDTAQLLSGKSWGVGILGFIPQALREEQTQYILNAMPPVVLIAGGRPSLAKPFEKKGIKVFLHVPSAGLLDMFLKEGARNFIFEGRECGGHLGPLSSFVLWEKQIFRLLKEDNISALSVFFAGGIHDAFSSALISIMSATLVARGAKVGVLMGSSYIYTKEAVESGAILEEYQKRSIAQNETVLLEAAPGQETRSLKSPFTDFFLEEKKRLQEKEMDSKEIWMHLEDLNIGRLRIASKGVERKDNEVVNLSSKEQFDKGLYMIGQITALRHEVISMRDLHESTTNDSNKLISELEVIPINVSKKKPMDIAIVGMSCIFPEAKNLEEYWKNIVLGKDCITEVPDSRWNKDLFFNPDTRDTDYVPTNMGGFIPTIEFDPLEFGMPPQTLASIEPTQLLSLYVAKRALDDAGYHDLSKIDNDNTSVIFGAEGATELAASYTFRAYAKQVFGELPDNVKEALPRLNEDSFAGVLSNVISGRIANRLNLGGRNYTVDAACGSSLAALDLGCQELYSNRSDMVLLGGADLHNGVGDYLMFGCTHALSRKGYSASFDANSDGIALGEGIAVLVLKRLEDAERDNNKIYAVIKGMGGSSDGKSLGMTAPNKIGQVKALERAYQSSGIVPSQVGMIEAHGTGTVVGDRTELTALTNAFLESGAVPGQTLLSSVKTQIGHTKCAAGMAGVVKTALSLYYGVQPPILHLKNPNAFYKEGENPFVFNSESGIWSSDRRIAGVSAFGFGGTNFHSVIEGYKKPDSFATALPLWPSELLVFRGNNITEAKEQLKKIQQLLSLNNSISIKDIAYSLATYNEKEIQISIVASTTDELLQQITIALSDGKAKGIYYRELQEGKVAFMFSGQGSQRVNMARDLMVAFPAMRRLLVQNKEYEKILYPNSVFDDASRKKQQQEITDTRNAQPVLGMVDFAIANYLRTLGIEPDTVAGHSYGELPALCFSGVFAPESLVSLSRSRAQSILDAVENDKGKMVAVGLAQDELNELLKGETEVWAVNFNSHKQTVLAGSTSGMIAFMEKMTQNKVSYKEINVACAFHSPLLKNAKGLYAKVLKDVEFNTPLLPIWSNTTAELYPETEKSIKERLTEHLIQPVLFSKQVENMYNDGVRVFVETGPGKVLTGLVQSILGDKAITIDTEGKNDDGVSYLLHSIAKYIATGRDLNFEKLFEDRNAVHIDIDAIDQYKKKPTNWLINGHNAVPSVGKMPAHGALPITKPLALNGLQTEVSSLNSSLGGSSEQILSEYLSSMKMVVQTQRDVMLGYLGEGQLISNPIQVTANATHTAPAPIQSTTSVSNKPATPIVSAPAATVVTSAAPKVSAAEVTKMLLDIVSEKTGYPADMLGMDLDLEADLSIDSIKRMEIVGALRDKLNIAGSMDDSEDVIERMASIKTLNGMTLWIEELVQANSNSMPQQPQNGAPATTPIASTPVPATTVASAPKVSAAEVTNMLLDIVSEKTGYPADMLGLDLDLEADLSIDSIKRMEIVGALRDKLNIAGSMDDSEDVIERMASIKTLNGMIAWIEELVQANSSSTPQQPQNVATDISTVPATTVASAPKVSAAEVTNMLLDIVSEKTGYPADMLGLDLDLEADLSIDSIKRMEIVGALRDKLNIAGSMDDSEDVIERMASIKTLNGMIAWIEELANPEQANLQISSPTVAPTNSTAKRMSFDASSILGEEKKEDSLARMRFILKPHAIDSSNKLSLNGSKFAITNDGDNTSYAKENQKTLEAKGASADLVTAESDLSSYNGLVILNASEATSNYTIFDAFNMIKKVNLEQVKWIYTFSDLLASLNQKDKMSETIGVQGFPGLLKSLSQEYPNVNFRTIDSSSIFKKETLSKIVLDELGTSDTSVEIVYDGSERFHYDLLTENVTTTTPTLSLDKEAVVLVFGGAQGISPELISQMSKAYPCKYILVGRSSEPTENDSKYASLETKNDIRQYLIKEEQMKSPAEIEKKLNRIFKANQIIIAKGKIEKFATEVTYKSLDIKNEELLRSFIKGIYKEYGRIDGVIHAAGLLDDKLFSQKTLESFTNVYDTKIRPLHVLLEEIHSDVKLFVMFSSVASAYGNKGQTDYASANSVFDLTSQILSKKIQGRVLTINWGPWKGAGMVSDQLENEFKKRGVSLIPLQEGAKYFVEELKYGSDNRVLVMGGEFDAQSFIKNNSTI